MNKCVDKYKRKQKDFKINPYPNYKINMDIDHLIVGLEMEADRVANLKKAQVIQNDYSDVFTVIACFKGTFLMQIKSDVKLYQVPPGL